MAQLSPSHTCIVLEHPTAEHLTQIRTGLAELAASGRVELSSRPDRDLRWTCDPPRLSAHRTLLRAVVDGTKRIVWDLDDASVVDANALAWSDVYWKRSCPRRPVAARVRPLGLNCPVISDGPDPVSWRDPTPARLLTPAAIDREEPCIVFYTRVWDPEEARSEDDRHQRLTINELRATLVSALRETYGAKFAGGLQPTPYALATFPDAVVPWARNLSKFEYLSIVRTAAVCVASMGLHGSVGWKMAEYIALSRAVVSESISQDLPGGFRAPDHYVAFDDVNAALQAVSTLLETPQRRLEIRRANARYFAAYARPATMVWRTLQCLA